MKYILIRHGECMHNIKKDESVPNALCSLTENGKQQSIIAAEHVKRIIDECHKMKKIYLYFSPYNRTRYMANKIIERIQCDKICEEPLLSEIQCGKFFSKEQYEQEYPQENECLKKAVDTKSRFWYRFKDGESPFDVYVRVRLFLTTLDTNENVISIILSHQITLRVLEMILLNKNIGWFEEGKRFSNGEIVVIENQNLVALD